MGYWNTRGASKCHDNINMMSEQFDQDYVKFHLRTIRSAQREISSMRLKGHSLMDTYVSAHFSVSLICEIQWKVWWRQMFCSLPSLIALLDSRESLINTCSAHFSVSLLCKIQEKVWWTHVLLTSQSHCSVRFNVKSDGHTCSAHSQSHCSARFKGKFGGDTVNTCFGGGAVFNEIVISTNTAF